MATIKVAPVRKSQKTIRIRKLWSWKMKMVYSRGCFWSHRSSKHSRTTRITEFNNYHHRIHLKIQNSNSSNTKTLDSIIIIVGKITIATKDLTITLVKTAISEIIISIKTIAIMAITFSSKITMDSHISSSSSNQCRCNNNNNSFRINKINSKSTLIPNNSNINNNNNSRIHFLLRDKILLMHL